MQEEVLALNNVAVAFGALRAVDKVTLHVARGQRRAIIGPNGAGKTTLFNAITGVIIPTEGQIIFRDQDITTLPPHQRAALGIARTFQITNLFPSLTVQENMILALQGLHKRKFSLFGTPDLDQEESKKI
jgi:branched-chain amino acid transport system ATP-binding protein